MCIRIRKSQIISKWKNPIGCLRNQGDVSLQKHLITAVCVNVKMISVNWPLSKGHQLTELTLKRTGLCCLDPLCVRSFPSCFCTSFFFGWTTYTEWMILLSNYNTRHYRCQKSPFLWSLSPVLCLKAVLWVSRVHYEIRADMWPTAGMWSSAQRQGKTTALLTEEEFNQKKIQHLIK